MTAVAVRGAAVVICIDHLYLYLATQWDVCAFLDMKYLVKQMKI